MHKISYKLLKEITKSDDALVYELMGNFGLDIKNFAKIVDLTHPDLNSLFEDFCQEDKNFLNKCFEIFRIKKYAKKNGFINSTSLFENNLNKFFKGKPFNKMMNIRLLKDKYQREQIRFFKKCKKIDLRFLNDNFWSDCSDSFDSYKRYDLSYQKEIDESLIRQKRYNDIGCSLLAAEIDQHVSDVKKNNETYYGYHQIKLTVASVILAKILNFSFKKGKVFKNELNYCSFIVPFHEVLQNFSCEFKNKIYYLESFPEAQGKPIFDIIALIVPTCHGYKCFEEKNYTEVINFFIKNKIYQSILVGEKNGRFYFIDLIS